MLFGNHDGGEASANKRHLQKLTYWEIEKAQDVYAKQQYHSHMMLKRYADTRVSCNGNTNACPGSTTKNSTIKDTSKILCTFRKMTLLH